MRGLTTRGVRPCLRHNSTIHSLPTIRQTILPPTRRGLTAADAFTILLAPVFTAAFVFDSTAKQDRMKEWDRQIAAVEAEAEKLRQKQVEAWSRIQHRSVRRGACEQRRMMSTIARSLPEVDEMDPFGQEKEIENSEGHLDPKFEVLQAQEQQDTQKRFERLIATRLALQLLLQIRISRTNMYTIHDDAGPGDLSRNQSMEYLVRELEKVDRLIHRIKIEHIPWGTQVPSADAARKEELAQQIRGLSERYNQKHIHLPDLVLSYAQLIAHYKLGPPAKSYVDLMRTFSLFAENSAMAVMCENALWDGHQLLRAWAVTNMIYRYGSDSDAGRMQEFLTRVTKVDSFPRTNQAWFRTTVHDIQIAVPATRNGHVLCALVRAALCNQQQTVAEAYATVFLQKNADNPYDGKFKWYMLSCFLQSYGAWGSWQAGLRWLETAVAWAKDLYDNSQETLGRVVLRMLDFCVACDQRESYETILEAAIQSSIPVPPLNYAQPLFFSDRMSQIRLDWIARVREQLSDKSISKRLTADAVKQFQQLLRGRFDKRGKMADTFFIEKDTWVDQPWKPLGGEQVPSPQPRIRHIQTVQPSTSSASANSALAMAIRAQDSARPSHAKTAEYDEVEEDSPSFASPFFQDPSSFAESLDGEAKYPSQQEEAVLKPDTSDVESSFNFTAPFYQSSTIDGQTTNRRPYSSKAFQPMDNYEYIAKYHQANDKVYQMEAQLESYKALLEEQKLAQEKQRLALQEQRLAQEEQHKALLEEQKLAQEKQRLALQEQRLAQEEQHKALLEEQKLAQEQHMLAQGQQKLVQEKQMLARFDSIHEAQKQLNKHFKVWKQKVIDELAAYSNPTTSVYAIKRLLEDDEVRQLRSRVGLLRTMLVATGEQTPGSAFVYESQLELDNYLSWHNKVCADLARGSQDTVSISAVVALLKGDGSLHEKMIHLNIVSSRKIPIRKIKQRGTPLSKKLAASTCASKSSPKQTPCLVTVYT